MINRHLGPVTLAVLPATLAMTTLFCGRGPANVGVYITRAPLATSTRVARVALE